MSILEKLHTRAADAAAEYVQILQREAAGDAKAKDADRLAALMPALGITESDVAADVAAMKAVRDAETQIVPEPAVAELAVAFSAAIAARDAHDREAKKAREVLERTVWAARGELDAARRANGDARKRIADAKRGRPRAFGVEPAGAESPAPQPPPGLPQTGAPVAIPHRPGDDLKAYYARHPLPRVTFGAPDPVFHD